MTKKCHINCEKENDKIDKKKITKIDKRWLKNDKIEKKKTKNDINIKNMTKKWTKSIKINKKKMV